jgi:hypothetical protein
VLQDKAAAARLIELLRVAPFVRCEFEIAYDPFDRPT